MKKTKKWVETYLSVLGIDKVYDLATLQFNHLKQIPFQNIVGIKKRINWIDFNDPESVVETALRREGGICFHLNYSFYLLLKHLGYKCYPISCRMSESDFDHMALVVELGKPYLVDVGFGEHFLTQPIPIVDGYILRDRSGVYQIRKINESYVLEKAGRNRWIFKYSFRLQPRSFKEFERTFIRHNYFRSGFKENTIYSRWINDNLFIRVYNQWISVYRNQSLTQKIKLEGFNMENVLRWNWLNGILVMLGSSDSSDSEEFEDHTYGDCDCIFPDYEEKKVKTWSGKTIIVKTCKKCGWSSTKI